MPAEAGIHSVGDNNNFKDLDSRFRGNNGFSHITTQSPRGEGREGVIPFGRGVAALCSAGRNGKIRLGIGRRAYELRDLLFCFSTRPLNLCPSNPFHGLRLQGDLDDFVHFLDEVKFHFLLHLVRNLLQVFLIFFGRMTVVMPDLLAARTFSLIPPTGRTRPRRVISPVMATSLRTGLPSGAR